MLLETPKVDTAESRRRSDVDPLDRRNLDDPAPADAVSRRLRPRSDRRGRRAARHRSARPALRHVCARNWSRVHPHSGATCGSSRPRCVAALDDEAMPANDDGVGIERIDRFERSEHRHFDVEIRRAPRRRPVRTADPRAPRSPHTAPPPLPAAAGTRGSRGSREAGRHRLQRDECAGCLGQIDLRPSPAADAPVTSAWTAARAISRMRAPLRRQ